MGTGWSWLRIGRVAGTCRYGEELSGSIYAGNFLTSGKVYWLVSQEGLCSMEYVSKCISWTIKCLILLMHGATMKIIHYILVTVNRSKKS